MPINRYMPREKYQTQNQTQNQTHENHDYYNENNEYKENQNEKQIEILFMKYYKLEEDVKELYKKSSDISSLHDINGLYKRFDNSYSSYNSYNLDKDKYEIEQNILQNYKSINELYNAINELQSGIRMLEKYNCVCVNKINSINFHIKILYFVFILLVIKLLNL